MAVVLYEKKYTETLSLMLQRFRLEYPCYAVSKITYAGRLDPMAKGLVPLLIDNDVHNKDYYLGKNKTYQVDFCFGVGTDSYDILGLVTDREIFGREVDLGDLDFLLGSYEQSYPVFSSRPINGKPLWQWSKEGRINEIDVPRKSIEVFSIEKIHEKKISMQKLQEDICTAVAMVEGDFRQDQIAESWSEYFENTSLPEQARVYRIELRVSSGTYVRDLVQRISAHRGVPAVCIQINRIHIDGLENIKVLTK